MALDSDRRLSGRAPLWAQIRDALEEAIGRGDLQVDDRLPGEAELAAAFGVGRPTVRQALAALRQEGLIHTRKGAGTFVSRRRPAIGLLGFEGLTSVLAQRGLPAETRVLGCAQQPAPPLEHLRVEGTADDAGWFVVERLRSLTGEGLEPFCLETDAFSLASCPDAERRFAETGSATAVLEERCGHVLGSADVATSAVAARGAVARHLRVRTGTPVLRMERVNRTPGGVAVHSAVFVVRTDRVPVLETVVRSATRPTVGRVLSDGGPPTTAAPLA